jgi:ubiquinone/menaquinone biosynthesis C-methylase UbiE
MSDVITKLTYQTFQQGKSSFALSHKTLSNRLRNLIFPPSQPQNNSWNPGLVLKIQQRMQKLLDADWEDSERGVYPVEILFDNPWEDFFSYYPAIWLDYLSIFERIKKRKYQVFSSAVDTKGYPRYYLQNFHHQTDGYLSEMSANLYDLQVEILFGGTADPMRRRILKPLKEGLSELLSKDEKPRILDIACGTGRTLKFIRATLPKASLYGIDLSPAYLRKANQLLSETPGELPQLIQANGEELPFKDNYFQATTSVFMFHELPHFARQNVIEEAFRVTEPGGIFIICDSIQAVDSPEMMPAMKGFTSMFHEPYYKHYINDDLVKRLEKAGFVDVATENHFMSKYWVARKPNVPSEN